MQALVKEQPEAKVKDHPSTLVAQELEDEVLDLLLYFATQYVICEAENLTK